MPNWVGDVVMATPALKALRSSFPSARITAVIDSDLQKIIQCSVGPDRIIPYKRKGTPLKALREFFRCTSEIKKEQNDLAVILPNSFSSALMMRIAGVPERTGYRRDSRRLLLSRSLPRPKDSQGEFAPDYMAKYYLRLCEFAGTKPHADIHPFLGFNPADMKDAEALLGQAGLDPDRPYILIHPHAGYGPSKLWPSGHFSTLAEMLKDEFGAQIGFIGSPSAGTLVAEIKERARIPSLDLTDCGLDLHLLKCAVKRSTLLISTDSGPRHYGVALDVPTVCIMGPTNPAYTHSGLPHDAVVRLDLECGPCQEKTCRSDHRCMKNISPEMVFKRCRKLISNLG